MTAFAFRVDAVDGASRTGAIATPHGIVRTPAFMPVGTQGAMKGIHWRDVKASGADIVLGNTYHLMLRPGAELIAKLGGLHKFLNWPHPILTDSGGFQVMSLAELRKVGDDGVTFRSHLDGAIVSLTPERAVEIQDLLGSDIAMQLDECIRLPQERREQERAMRLSLAWAERCKRAFEAAVWHSPGRALFGIVQGGDDRELRTVSARALVDIGFAGYAIGGLAVGEPQHVMLDVIETVAPLLPPIARVISWASARRTTFSKQSHAAWICLTACFPLATAVTGSPTRGLAPSTCATPATLLTRVRSIPKAAAQARGIMPAPICITWSRRTKCWAPCCSARSIYTITRT